MFDNVTNGVKAWLVGIFASAINRATRPEDRVLASQVGEPLVWDALGEHIPVQQVDLVQIHRDCLLSSAPPGRPHRPARSWLVAWLHQIRRSG